MISTAAILTCWHLLFSTLVTQIMARATTLLDSRKEVKMTRAIYLRAIVPIGVLYSASLVCSNQAYLYLSVAFIQMLKVSLVAFLNLKMESLLIRNLGQRACCRSPNNFPLPRLYPKVNCNHQRPSNRLRRHPRLLRRSAIRLARFYLPSSRHLHRSHAARHDPNTALWRRPES